ncbi:hypothetical protein [uncultured Rikenella sp.]|uniref:hypothetical protein n=1 Tax=uncultured Rikenella sp. TaxID=368003 RepID=UPI002629A343|nr:hypothetical protein [uncultured Rikenella sp.]
MLINKDSLKVRGIDNFTSYITEVEYGYNKLWGSDSGRNLAGTNSGTLVGIFPKIKVSFRKLSQQELEAIAPILDNATQWVTYYDPVLKRLYEMDTYTGDWATANRNTFSNVAHANESFDISFIANRKRPSR